MIGAMRWVAVAAATGLGTVPPAAHAPLPAMQEPAVDGPDIVVIARKLRKVRIHYVMRGPYVRSCTTEKSSGDERIDRIMCAILRACVASGHVDVEPARACMAARIDSLDDAGQAAMLRRAVAAPPPPPVPQPPVPQPDAPRPDGPDIVVTGQNEPDIVVTGSNPTMRGGLWQFRRTATLVHGGGGTGRSARFTQCLPPGAIEAMLRRAAGEGAPLPGAGRCDRLKMTFADGRIAGRRSCSSSGLDPANPGLTAGNTSRLNLTGRYDSRQLTLNYNVEVDHDGVERGGGPGWNPRRPGGTRWQVTATRSGDCPSSERVDQLNGNEIVAALFGEDGPED